MNKTFDKSAYSERLQELRNQYELAQESTKQAEQKLNEAKDNESKSLADMTDFIKKSFVKQLKEFFDGAPVAIQVFNHSKDNVLPPEDEPDMYGVRILPTVLQENKVYVKGEYASVNPIEMDFIDIYHGQHPWIERYDDYYPSYTNIIFLPDDGRWVKSRYIPVKDFSVIKGLMERNQKLYMERLDEEIRKLKEISTDDVCKRLTSIVRGNLKYYKETVEKAKKWFDDCVKLAEEHKTEH